VAHTDEGVVRGVRRPGVPVGTHRRGLPPGLVASVMMASLAVYLAASVAVRQERAQWGYRAALLGSAPWRAAGALLSTPAVAGVVAAGLWLIATTCFAIAAARAARGRSATLPDALAWGLVGAIAPSLLVAAVRWPDGDGLLRSPIVPAVTLVAALGIAAVGWARARRSLASAPLVSRPMQGESDVAVGWVVPLAVAAALLLGAVAVDGWTAIQGFDSFGYHLPLAVRWSARARLVTGPEVALNAFYPSDFELLLRWIVPATTDRLAFAASLLAGVGCLYALYCICREIGQPTRVALTSALASLSVPLYARLGTTTYSDTFVAFALALAVVALLRWRRLGARDTGLVAAMGASLGIAVGTKYSAAPMATLVILVWLALAFVHGPSWRDERDLERVDGRWLVRQLAVVAAAGAACSTYWYVRNLVEHGNPVFPIALPGLRGVEVGYLVARAPETATAWWPALLHPWVDFQYASAFEGGLGPAVAGVIVPALVLTPFARGRAAPGRGVVLALTVGGWAAWLLTGRGLPRYGLFPLLLAFGLVGELWLACRSAVVRAATVGCVIVSMLVTTRALLADAAYVLVSGRTALSEVRAAVDALPPGRLLNAVGGAQAGPAGYDALGSRAQHDVVTPYRAAEPGDAVRYGAAYLLVPDSAVARFAAVLDLVPLGRVRDRTGAPLSLWRVGGARHATTHPTILRP